MRVEKSRGGAVGRREGKRTFRMEANELLARVRRLQIRGLALTVVGALLMVPGTWPWLQAAALLCALCGVALTARAHWLLRRELMCPGCGHDLRFLVFDPSYAGKGTNGFLVTPKEFAPKTSGCGYCGRSFDEEAVEGGR